MNAQDAAAMTSMVITPTASPDVAVANDRCNISSALNLSEQQSSPQDPLSDNNSSNALLLPPAPISMDDDKVQAMLFMEEARYESPEDYLLKVGSGHKLNGYATENWRKRLCEWMFEVADHFGFDREVVSVSAYIMDRIASMAFDARKQNHATKRQFQLDAVASLYLALKVHGEMDPDSGEERIKLRLSNFVELSRGFFSEAVIVAKEMEILEALNWHINPPTCAQFLSHYLELMPDWTVDGQAEGSEETEDDTLATRRVIWIKVFDVAKYLTELSVFVSDFSFNYKPSTVSYAALLCALEYVQDQTPFPRVVHAQLLNILSRVSPSLFEPYLEDIQDLQDKLKRLAPDFFPAPSNQRIIRTVSMSDVESANHIAAAPIRSSNNKDNKRSITPTCDDASSQQEPCHKKARRGGSESTTTAEPRRLEQAVSHPSE